MITREQQKHIDEKLNVLLFDIDPIGIGTKENNLTDEYQLEAIEIVKFISAYCNTLQSVDIDNLNNSIQKSIETIFSESFAGLMPSVYDVQIIFGFLYNEFSTILLKNA